MMLKRPSHNHLRTLFGITLVLFLWALPGVAWSEVVVLHLKNGDRITGTIVSEDTNRVVLGTAWTKEIVVPVSQIERRQTSAVAATRPAAIPPPAVPARTAPPPPKPPKHWHGDAQLGLDVAFSERDRQLYTGRLKLSYVRDRFRNLFDYNAAYGKNDGLLSANRMDGISKTDFDVGKRIFVYNLAGAGYDEIRKIDLRYEVGPGVGYHIMTRSNMVFNAEYGLNYQAQHLSDHTTRENIFHRLAEDSTWRFFKKLTVDEKLELFPRADLSGDYRVRFETNWRYWLLQNLSLTLTVFDLYDTQPAAGIGRNDLQVRSTLGVTF